MVELGNALQNYSVLEPEVFASSDSSDAKLRFQPSTTQLKTYHFRIVRFYDASQHLNSSFDLAWFISVRDSRLDFYWKVEVWSPRIISSSAFFSVRIYVIIFAVCAAFATRCNAPSASQICVVLHITNP
jgi:hypothetical protein